MIKWFNNLHVGIKVLIILGVIFVLFSCCCFSVSILSVGLFDVEEDKVVKEDEKPKKNSKKEEKKTFSSIKISEVKVVDNKVSILGTTDLPNKSKLMIDLDVWGRSESDQYVGVSKDITVKNGNFQVELSPPQREEFKKGPYEISVMFTPKGQTPDVIKIVGKDGEKLTGNLVEEVGEFKILKLVEKKDLKLAINLPKYTFQQPSEFKKGTAEYTLSEYALAWKDQDWDRMTKYTQKTWLEGQDDPADMLSAWYDFKTLKGFEVINSKKVSDVIVDVTFNVQYEAMTNQISNKEITARIIKETGPYKPSINGSWGVNPISTLDEK